MAKTIIWTGSWSVVCTELRNLLDLVRLVAPHPILESESYDGGAADASFIKQTLAVQY